MKGFENISVASRSLSFSFFTANRGGLLAEEETKLTSEICWAATTSRQQHLKLKLRSLVLKVVQSSTRWCRVIAAPCWC